MQEKSTYLAYTELNELLYFALNTYSLAVAHSIVRNEYQSDSPKWSYNNFTIQTVRDDPRSLHGNVWFYDVDRSEG